MTVRGQGHNDASEGTMIVKYYNGYLSWYKIYGISDITLTLENDAIVVKCPIAYANMWVMSHDDFRLE